MTAPPAPSAEDVRAELAAIAPDRACDRMAEVSALFHSAGSLHLKGRGAVALHLDLASSAVARRAFALLRALGISSEIRTYERRAFDRATRFQLHVDGDADAIATLGSAGVVDAVGRPLERPPWRVVARACCRGSYLRGAFLGGGSLSGPPSPHLELRTASVEGAELLRDIAAKQGATLRVLARPTHALAYAKGWEHIEAVLGAAGATDAVLALEERSVVAGARELANRAANADHANLVRQSRAAREQLDAVEQLRKLGVLDSLSDPLREAADLRARHPTLSLAELARKTDPPATKASLHRRLRRLVELGSG